MVAAVNNNRGSFACFLLTLHYNVNDVLVVILQMKLSSQYVNTSRAAWFHGFPSKSRLGSSQAIDHLAFDGNDLEAHASFDWSIG
jgi:hypothetical protein